MTYNLNNRPYARKIKLAEFSTKKSGTKVTCKPWGLRDILGFHPKHDPPTAAYGEIWLLRPRGLFILIRYSGTVLRRLSVKVEAHGGNEEPAQLPQWKLSMPPVRGSCFGWKPKISPKPQGFQVCPPGFPGNFLCPIFWYQIRPI